MVFSFSPDVPCYPITVATVVWPKPFVFMFPHTAPSTNAFVKPLTYTPFVRCRFVGTTVDMHVKTAVAVRARGPCAFRTIVGR